MKRLIIVILIMCDQLYNCDAQTVLSSGSANPHDMETWLVKNQLRSFNEENNSVGDMFYADWSTGSVTFLESNRIVEGQLRYNEFKNELLMKFGDVSYILSPEKINSFVLQSGGKKILFVSIEMDGIKTFFELCYNGNIDLVVKHTTKLIKKDGNSQAYGSGVAYDKYVKDDQFYIVKNNELIPFDGKKKDLEQLFGDKAEEVKDFMKSQNISLKDTDDLTKLFDHYKL